MPQHLVKMRSTDREPSSHVRARRTKRPRRNKSLDDEEVGDFIVVDTGIIEDTRTSGNTETIGEAGTAGDTGTVEDNGTIKDTATVEGENPKTTSASSGPDATGATLQGDRTAVQSKHQKSDTNFDATQKARDALFVLDSAPDFVEKARNRLHISLYIPSPDGESQQSGFIRPSINTYHSASATESSSGLAHLHNREWSPPPTDAPDDSQRPPRSAKLSSSSQELSPPAIPALKQCQPNPNTLPVRKTKQSAREPSTLRRIDKPQQSKLMAKGDHCSLKFSISGVSIDGQTRQPASIDSPPPHHTNRHCLGNVRNDEVRTRPHTQSSDLPDDPQAFLHLPGQASRQNMGVGEPWAGSPTGHHDQPAQQFRKLRPDGAGKASQSQGIPPFDPNKLQQSSTGMTTTNNSICQAPRLARQPLLEQNPFTSLPVSNCPGPALSLSPTPSNFAGTRATTPQVRSIPAQVNHVGHQPLKPTKDPSPSHHNSMWMNVMTGVFETSRTANDKKRLRNRAAEFIAGREDVELEEDETTGGRKRVYPDVCGAVVDKFSAKGLVAITVHGFSVQQVDTGQGLIGEPYEELTIGVGQTCVIHGSSTVLYYKPRKVPASDHAQASQPRAATQPRESSIHELIKLASSPPEIAVRLQMDGVGKFSAPYEFSVWRREIKTTEFFAWFGRQTGRGGVKGPPLLTFTLKDAMPDRKSRDIAILNEDDFRWMRKHIITQFDKAKLFMPGLKDFTVLVTDPGWVSHSRRR
ncbi:hypothetical protein BKA61DRAFT_739936 [Leptodontidium sp. MPI-SDFR-AT-0119]|nr:hypothetical protein BKA61DRAFT_739936 [Leptodontidium sp. MPI-SDFR-AT-0119]